MITPTKGIAPDRALLAIGAQILISLDEPLTVSQAWARFKDRRTRLGHHAPVSFEWFVLGLDVLHALGAVELRQELLVARRNEDAAPALR
ncbi:ABC-three component system middle component 6 [Streptomyces sp. NPDC006678]|uniref:ABC-three component system middle component 6 n=1 Tax=Streptomyces sp. NPDC006678 TaxID=3157185 RepID=UPI0033F64D14